MNESRVIIAQFCDDVRHEVGNKYSLMGCYGNELIVDKLPAVLTKFCIQILATTPITQPFSKLVLRAIFNGDTIAEIDVLHAQLQVFTPRPESNRLISMAIMAFSPVGITEPCRLYVEAETEDSTLPSNSLWIRERTPDDPKL
jgi:hypothetical protein